MKDKRADKRWIDELLDKSESNGFSRNTIERFFRYYDVEGVDEVDDSGITKGA